jgi:lipoprotein-releasing system permease protein
METATDSRKLKYDSYDLIIRTVEGSFKGAEAVGYTKAGIRQWQERLKKIKPRSGIDDFSLENGEFELEKNEVAIGTDLARSLGLFEGDEITLIPPETLLLSSLETPLFEKVVVKRLLATDLSDLDSKLVLFNKDLTLNSFTKTLSRKSGFHIWASSVENTGPIYSALTDKKVNTQTWLQKNADLFFALKLEKLMIGIFLGLAGLIASSSILTVLALLMSQKKRDIAIIKTLGLSQSGTLWVFTKMGLWISAGGIIIGSIIGVSISYYLEINPMNIMPNIYYDSTVPALVDFFFVIVVMAGALFLAFLGAYLPALMTLRIQPALLLREKN